MYRVCIEYVGETGQRLMFKDVGRGTSLAPVVEVCDALARDIERLQTTDARRVFVEEVNGKRFTEVYARGIDRRALKREV